MGEQLNHENIIRLLRQRIRELKDQPEYLWREGYAAYATESGGVPAVKVGVANCSIDFDLWHRLRNPAMLGQHPAGLREIWEFYASRRTDSTAHPGEYFHGVLISPTSTPRTTYKSRSGSGSVSFLHLFIGRILLGMHNTLPVGGFGQLGPPPGWGIPGTGSSPAAPLLGRRPAV